MKRKAYIGLSSPTGYFYDHEQKHFKQPWRWNPVLESPQGLITLFDELWFLSRALCPVSLREEQYVKFMDEDSDFVPLIKALTNTLEAGHLEGLAAENSFLEDVIDLNSDYPTEQFKRYSEVISYAYGTKPHEAAPIDNHTHGINLCGFNVSGNSMRLDLLAFDVAMIGRMGVRNIELVTNSFNNTALKVHSMTLQNTKLSQGITIKRIPVLQTPQGPIIDRIDSIRENNYLCDFREKILTTSDPDNYSELVEKIESEFTRYRNDVLINKQKGSRLITSLAKNALSFLAGQILPGVGELKSIKEDARARNFNWTGFLAEVENRQNIENNPMARPAR
jgi:hypothetical protein